MNAPRQPSNTTHGAGSIAFPPFLLDRRAARLTRNGQAIPLRPKTWEVLLYLAERPGVLVTRDELLDAVWPDVAVTPSTLTKSISELRTVLADDPRQPRCIETVHRRGFRFIAKTKTPGAEVTLTGLENRPSSETMFVGREAELRQLDRLLARACGGERQIAFVTGEAGIGKSALVDAFLSSATQGAAATPIWVARGLSVEQHGAREAYMPVLDVIETLARRPEAAGFNALLRRIAPTWFVQIPSLLGDDADAAQWAMRSAKPERMLRELAALIEAATADVTLVIVLEDLHWADASTIDLLSFHGQRSEPARLLVICTYRPAEVSAPDHALAPVVQSLKARGRCVELPLRDLSPRELQTYLELRFPGADFVAALAAKIHAYTDGNPLFMISVLQHGLQRGWIVETDPGWALAIPLERWRLEVPEDTQQAIEHAYQRLAPADRELLRAAGLVGVEFAAPVVAAALGRSVDDVEACCEQLVRAQWFLRTAGGVEWPDGSVAQHYAFIHDLYRQVACATVPIGRRQRLHQRIGEALEVAYGDGATEIAATLASHFVASRDCKRALHHLVAAGNQALRRLAHREALRSFEDALVQVLLLPDRSERLDQELALRLAMMPSMNEVYGPASEQVRRHCERAHALCLEAGRPEQLFHILYSLTHLYWNRADKQEAPAVLRRLNELAQQLGTPEHSLWANTSTIRTAYHCGQYEVACRLAAETLPGLESGGLLAFMHGPHPVVAASYHVALATWMLGDSARARDLMQASLAAAWETGMPTTLAGALWVACLLEVLARNTEEARRLAELVLSLSTEQGAEYWNSLALGLMGWVLVQSGEARDGLATLSRARLVFRATNLGLMRTYFLAFEAEGHLQLGDIDAGLAVIDEALLVAETSVDRSYWPELWRLKGELLLAALPSRAATRLRSQAEDCLSQALELARATGARALELRAATSLARAWRAWGRAADARSLLSGICGWFGEQVASVDLAEARALLSELARDAARLPRPPAAGKSRATRRQR